MTGIKLVESPYDFIACTFCRKEHLRINCPKRVQQAAADLLAACEANVSLFDLFAPIREANNPGGNKADPRAIALARAAIAKARGQ